MGIGHKQVKYNMKLKILSAKGEKVMEGIRKWESAGGREEFQFKGIVRKVPKKKLAFEQRFIEAIDMRFLLQKQADPTSLWALTLHVCIMVWTEGWCPVGLAPNDSNCAQNSLEFPSGAYSEFLKIQRREEGNQSGFLVS